ncbi:MAG: ABC transporter permease [Holophaga sp.]|nr:ABC transporter permease [Holophaga sp.]
MLILKKEFMELSKDRKTLFFTFVMPLILYPLIFLMLGRLGSSDAASRAGRPSRVCLTDPAQVLAGMLRDERQFQVVPRPPGDVRQAIRDQKLELALEVDPDGARKLARSETLELRVLYDNSDESSKLALERFKGRLRSQETLWVQARLRNLGASPQLALPVRLETVEAGGMGLFLGKLVGSFLPYLLMIMMYAGAMQHGIYATAGEKERGTLLSLLATRLPRTQIILGKLLYIFSIGILSALVNLLSMAFSMGRLMASTGAGDAPAQAAVTGVAALATPAALGLTFLLMVPLGLFFANFILLGGIQARNTLEASTALTPGIFVVVLLGVFSMAPGIEKMAWLPFVPVLNVSLAIRKLFSQQADVFQYLVALGMTLALAGVMTWISTRMLDRESAIFRA